MKNNFFKIMAYFLAMTLILLNIPVAILAAPSTLETGIQVSVVYDPRHMEEVTTDTTLGSVQLIKKGIDDSNKSMTAYGSMWLTLTQFEVSGGTFTNQSPREESQKIKSVDLYEVDPLDNSIKKKIASFSKEGGTLDNMQLPDSYGNIHKIENEEELFYGCKILLRAPLDRTPKTYQFEITRNDEHNTKFWSGSVTVRVKKLDKPLLIPPTIGKTDGFTRTLDDKASESSVQVYAMKDIVLKDNTIIPKGSLIIEKLRDNSRLSRKKIDLQEKLQTLSPEQLLKYAKTIDKHSLDPAWTPNLDISTLVNLRVDREDIEFYTPNGQPPIVSYDRDYVSEVNAIISTERNTPKYHSSVNATVKYFSKTAGEGALATLLNEPCATDVLILVSMDQSSYHEDAPTSGAVYNTPLWPDLYNADPDNVVIQYDLDRDRFFTQVKLNIVALYTGYPKNSSTYTNKNVRAFIFTNQTGQQAGYIFSDAPTPDIQAQEVPGWSTLLTELRQSDKFQVGSTTEDLYLYDSSYNGRTMIAAWNKCSFVGADSKVELYGAASSPCIVDAGKIDDDSYYASYYNTKYEPAKRFLPGTFVFTPSGVLGDQIGYRIVYEQYLLDELKKEPWGISDDKLLNALNALIATDTDAFRYYTGLSKTQQELNTWLYTKINGSGAMAEEFIIDSVQDMVDLSTPTVGGTVTYDYGVAGGDINYMIPQAKGCLSYTVNIQDAQLASDDNEFSKVTTEIDFAGALDKVYDPLTSSYKEDIVPETNIDTAQLTFIVEKKAAGTSKFTYHPALTNAISGVTVSEDGKLTIEFSKKDGESSVYFDNELAEYRISVMFPVTLKEGLTSEIYRNGSGIQRHMPYINPSNPSSVFPRYRKVKTTTVVRYKKKTTYDLAGNPEEYNEQVKQHDETLQLVYKDFTDIK